MPERRSNPSEILVEVSERRTFSVVPWVSSGQQRFMITSMQPCPSQHAFAIRHCELRIVRRFARRRSAHDQLTRPSRPRFPGTRSLLRCRDAGVITSRRSCRRGLRHRAQTVGGQHVLRVEAARGRARSAGSRSPPVDANVERVCWSRSAAQRDAGCSRSPSAAELARPSRSSNPRSAHIPRGGWDTTARRHRRRKVLERVAFERGRRANRAVVNAPRRARARGDPLPFAQPAMSKAQPQRASPSTKLTFALDNRDRATMTRGGAVVDQHLCE